MMSRCGGCGLHVPEDEVLAAQTLAPPGNYSYLLHKLKYNKKLNIILLKVKN